MYVESVFVKYFLTRLCRLLCHLNFDLLTVSCCSYMDIILKCSGCNKLNNKYIEYVKVKKRHNIRQIEIVKVGNF